MWNRRLQAPCIISRGKDRRLIIKLLIFWRGFPRGAQLLFSDGKLSKVQTHRSRIPSSPPRPDPHRTKVTKHTTRNCQLPQRASRISSHHIHHDHPAAAHIHAGRHHRTHTSRRNIVPFLRKHCTAALSALQRPISTPPLAGPRRERRTGVTVKPAPLSVSVEFHSRAPG